MICAFFLAGLVGAFVAVIKNNTRKHGIKTRRAAARHQPAANPFMGTSDFAKRIYRQEGWRG